MDQNDQTDRKASSVETLKIVGILGIFALIAIMFYATTAFIPNYMVGIYTHNQESSIIRDGGIHPFSASPLGYIELMDQRIQHERFEVEVVPEYRHLERVYVDVYWFVEKGKSLSLYRNYGGDRERINDNAVRDLIESFIKKYYPEKALELYGEDRGNYIDKLIKPSISKELKKQFASYSFGDFYENTDERDQKIAYGNIAKILEDEGIVPQGFRITKERDRGYYGYLYPSVQKQAKEKDTALKDLIASGQLRNFSASAGYNGRIQEIIANEIRDEMKLWNAEDLYENESRAKIEKNINERIKKKIEELRLTATTSANNTTGDMVGDIAVAQDYRQDDANQAEISKLPKDASIDIQQLAVFASIGIIALLIAVIIYGRHVNKIADKINKK